jgi:hypothetical protein
LAALSECGFAKRVYGQGKWQAVFARQVLLVNRQVASIKIRALGERCVQ